MLPMLMEHRRLAVVGLVGILLGSSQAVFGAPSKYQKQTAKLDARKIASEAAPQTAPVFLKGDVAAFGVLNDDVQARLGFACAKQGNLTRVSEVRPSGEASYKGLRVGDQILDARLNDGVVTIKIQRDQSVYEAQLSLNPEPPKTQYRAAIPQSDAFNPQPFQLRTTQLGGYAADSKDAAALSRYNFELIIDRSMSMRHRDCPGNMSRWDWCAQQAVGIAAALEPYSFGRGHTITRFATEFDVHENVGTQMTSQLLSRNDFEFGTCMNDPLAARLEHHFRTYRPGDKPLLLAVITDGVPFPRPQPKLVIQTLVNASYRMKSPDEIKVVFLQVGGDDPRGRNYLAALGNSLVSYGAKFQYVQTQPFEYLTQVGLAKALSSAVQGHATQTPTRNQIPTAPSIARQFSRIRQQ